MACGAAQMEELKLCDAKATFGIKKEKGKRKKERGKRKEERGKRIYLLTKPSTVNKNKDNTMGS